MRSATILSAAVMAVILPAVALAAPSGGLPAHHPMPRTFGSMPASSSRAGQAEQQPFKVHFESNVRPQSRALDPPTTWNAFQWQERHPISSRLYVPVWSPAGCYGDAALAGPAALLSTPIGTSAPATEFTIGSLTGGQSSNLFGSSPSDVARVASAGGNAAATSSPLTLQYGFGTTSCGTTNPFSF